MSKSNNSGDQDERKGSIFIGEGVTVTGSFSIPGRAVVNGTLNGELSADELLVGEQGMLVGKITARNADIHGKTNDTLTVSNHLVIRASGRVNGKASYGELEIERGGLVSGTIAPADEKARAIDPPVLTHIFSHSSEYTDSFAAVEQQ